MQLTSCAVCLASVAQIALSSDSNAHSFEAMATEDTIWISSFDSKSWALLDKASKTELASNRAAGEWIIERHTVDEWFLKPGTLWDGCISRKQAPETGATRTWWTIQKEIEDTRETIRHQMESFGLYDSCRAQASTLFETAK